MDLNEGFLCPKPAGIVPFNPELVAVSQSFTSSWLHEASVTVYSDSKCHSKTKHMTDDTICAGLKKALCQNSELIWTH